MRSIEHDIGLVIKAVLKEETKKPEELAAAVVETETRKLRKIALEEMKEVWETAFKKGED